MLILRLHCREKQLTCHSYLCPELLQRRH